MKCSKKHKMKKRAKSKATTDIADKELQNAYRRRYAGEFCESCLIQPFQVIHHHILKSKSNYLRFKQPKNYIKLCHFCHSRIIFGDNQIVARYSLKRGKKWVKKMDELRKIRKSHYSKAELNDIIIYYQKWKLKKEQPTRF